MLYLRLFVLIIDRTIILMIDDEFSTLTINLLDHLITLCNTFITCLTSASVRAAGPWFLNPNFHTVWVLIEINGLLLFSTGPFRSSSASTCIHCILIKWPVLHIILNAYLRWLLMLGSSSYSRRRRLSIVIRLYQFIFLYRSRLQVWVRPINLHFVFLVDHFYY